MLGAAVALAAVVGSVALLSQEFGVGRPHPVIAAHASEPTPLASTPAAQVLAPVFNALLPYRPVITPDQAIQRAKDSDDQGDATSIQAFLEVAVPDSTGGLVVTRGADPSPPNVVVWDVVWKGVCIVPNGVPGTAPIPSCAPNHTWHTIINATSGKWIESGTGTPDEG